MGKKHDKQVFFVAKAMRLNITQDVELAAVWFRDNKAWKLSHASAIERFKAWLPQN